MVNDNSFLYIKDWFIDVIPFEVMWMDETANIVYANKRFCQNLGFKKKELLKFTVYDINPSLTKESWNAHWERVKNNETDHFTTTHRTKSGKLMEVEVTARFFSNEEKNYICAIFRDITESRFYQNLLTDTEQSIHVGGWKLNLTDGSIIATNEALSVLGVTESSNLLPGQVIELFKESEFLKNSILALIRKGKAYEHILEVKKPTNGVKWVRCKAHPTYKKDTIENIIGTYQDVTAQYQREQSLKLFREVIDNAEDIIFLWERDGNLFHYNQSALRQLGFSKKELDRATIFFMDPGITPEWWASHFEEIVTKKTFTFEWIATRKDGTKFPVEITVNHVNYGGKELNCAVLRNISDRKKKDLELFKALEEIKSLKNQLEIENEYLQEEISQTFQFGNIIYKSKQYTKVLQQVEQVAPTNTTVLITGESGTGKELLARAVHDNSHRKERTLIKVNCATLPKELIESELFGHKKGAFTGAVADKIGKFKLADGGSIFLDEIGELPVDLQPKLLRVLQEGEFDALGSTVTTSVDVRIIAATNRDLLKMVKNGSFREDLYYRLNVFPVYNIPLRERKEDIPFLAQFFLEKYAAKAGKAFKRLSVKTIDRLMKYDFPGNIRELENLIERAVIIESGTTLQPGNWLPAGNDTMLHVNTGFKSFDEIQKEYIIQVLQHTNWRVSGPNGAANILNINHKTLFAKMKKLGIEKKITLKE